MAAKRLVGRARGTTLWYIAEIAGQLSPEDVIDSNYVWIDVDTGDVWEKLPNGQWVNRGPIMGSPGGGIGDGLPPPKVGSLELFGGHVTAVDGTLVSVIIAKWLDFGKVHGPFSYEFDPAFETFVDDPATSTPADLLGYEVQVVPEGSGWSVAFSRRVGKDVRMVAFEGALAATTYWGRIRAYDVEGNYGPWSDIAIGSALPDAEAPPKPEGFGVAAGFRMVAAYWMPSPAPDLAHYQVDVRRTGDDLADPIIFESLTTRLIIGDLESEVEYAIRVRAVDRSGNSSEWTDTLMATPTLLVPADLAVDALVANFITTGVLDASAIRSGSLSVGGPGNPTGIFVYDQQNRAIGTLGERGFVMVDPLDPGNAVYLYHGELLFTDQYTGDPETTTAWRTAIGPDGINADAIHFGALGGGNNRIPNASVELVLIDRRGSRQSKAWTEAADWATVLRPINLEVTGPDLTMATL